MSNRLSKITTRTGDDGSTGLGDGSRVAKDDARIHALGEVDELNASLGVLLAEALPNDIKQCLRSVQHDLFELGGELCIPGHQMLDMQHVVNLDQAIERYNATLPPLAEFILPGGTRAAALAHVCRTVCRRAERAIITLAQRDTVRVPVKQYVNRLSDLLFVLSRTLNRVEGCADVLWQRRT